MTVEVAGPVRFPVAEPCFECMFVLWFYDAKPIHQAANVVPEM